MALNLASLLNRGLRQLKNGLLHSLSKIWSNQTLLLLLVLLFFSGAGSGAYSVSVSGLLARFVNI